ncbi:hypothetical protein SAMN04488564_106373 [Lentzea waywayandensis]|uniref:Uncharacterized protein n=1 Tax=Lentzea waywayandensis TaxID=84724 RepID=A0A1I6EZ48_9PSEU|nr:hypothetical protein [Lentzea waywayandensis]SFR22812.1 hypothetical protein SAMN04488564_106373 [Lentzea waywayandensis]
MLTAGVAPTLVAAGQPVAEPAQQLSQPDPARVLLDVLSAPAAQSRTSLNGIMDQGGNPKATFGVGPDCLNRTAWAYVRGAN